VPEPAEGAVAVLLLVTLEIGGGGVEEQQVHLQVEQVGHGEEHRLLHPAGGVGVHQQVHRPIGLVLVHGGQSRDRGVLADPLGGGQLAHRRDRPVGDQREQHPFHVGGEPPRVGGRPHRRAYLEAVPELVQQPDRPGGAGVDDLERRRPGGHTRLDRVGQAVAVAEVLVDRGGQPAQPGHVDLVDPAQVHQHVRLDPPAHPPVVCQGHVTHCTAVGVGPRREPQEHDYDSIIDALPAQGVSRKSCYYTFRPSNPFRSPAQPVDLRQLQRGQTHVPTNCGTPDQCSRGKRR
jgi:hypothetical protein